MWTRSGAGGWSESKNVCFCPCLGHKICPWRVGGQKWQNSVHVDVECTLMTITYTQDLNCTSTKVTYTQDLNCTSTKAINMTQNRL